MKFFEIFHFFSQKVLAFLLMLRYNKLRVKKCASSSVGRAPDS